MARKHLAVRVASLALAVLLAAASTDTPIPDPTGRLLFTMDPEGTLHTVDVATHEIGALTGAGDETWHATYSPYGERIAAVRGSRIILLDSQGFTVSTVVDIGPDRVLGAPVWSPDASKIAFTRYPGDCRQEEALCRTEVWTVRADGAGLHRVAGDESLHAWLPTWSPDGTALAFTRGHIDCFGDCQEDVWTAKADGSELARLTTDPAADHSPTWHPDGQTIAFVANRTGENDVMIMAADGSSVANLTKHPDDDGRPQWSPDGTLLMFTRGEPPCETVSCHTELFVMDADGGGLTNLTNDGNAPFTMAWSKAGDLVGFTSRRDGGENRWVVRPDGAGIQQLTTSGGVYTFDWAPVGVARFGDVPEGHVFMEDVNWLSQQGITMGCNPPANTVFCPADPVTRAQMAAFLVRAMGYTDDGGGDLFVDDDGSIFEADIDRLAAAGVTYGCNPPDNDKYCPSRSVTRAEMAAFLRRALS